MQEKEKTITFLKEETVKIKKHYEMEANNTITQLQA